MANLATISGGGFYKIEEVVLSFFKYLNDSRESMEVLLTNLMAATAPLEWPTTTVAPSTPSSEVMKGSQIDLGHPATSHQHFNYDKVSDGVMI